MKKYNKNLGITLSVAVIATYSQIATLSHALEPNKNQTTLEKNIEEHVLQNLDDTKSEVVAVTNKIELISALENENVKIVDIKNDIYLSEWTIMHIKGNGKEIRGNGNEIKMVKDPEHHFVEPSRIYVNTDTKIDNLKLNEIKIRVEHYDINLDIVNHSEISNGGILYWGDVTLENIKVNNGSIYGYGNMVVDSSKMKNTTIEYIGDEGKTLKIINTQMNGKWYSSAPIFIQSGNVELENIKIVNPGDYAIYTMQRESRGKKETNIRIKGTLEIDGAKKDAIFLTRDHDWNTENPSEPHFAPLELHIDGDIKQKGDTYTIKAQEGPYIRIYYNESKIKKVIDKWSYVYYNTKNREGNEPDSIVYTNKLVGEDRYKTAIKISNEGWDEARNVIVVNSNSMVDALSATPFADLKSAPILLTEKNKLNSETKKEISRLGPENVYVIGGESVVSDSVINELESMDITVERISGNDRYETSLEVAKKLSDYIRPISSIAVVNGVTGLPDAVSIAPVAADENMPIVLASPNEGTKVFDKYIKDNNIKKSYVIGNKAAISNEIANKLPNPERLGGIDRNETNAVILEKFYTSEVLNNIFMVKDGMKKQDDLIDALSVGVLASRKNSPVVIVGNDLNDKQESLLSKKQPKEITQVGGNGNENVFNKLVNMFKN